MYLHHIIMHTSWLYWLVRVSMGLRGPVGPRDLWVEDVHTLGTQVSVGRRKPRSTGTCGRLLFFTVCTQMSVGCLKPRKMHTKRVGYKLTNT